MAKHDSKNLTTTKVVDTLMQALGSELHEEGLGLVVLCFEHEGGTLSYGSTGEREDVAAMLVEWLGRLSPGILAQAVERWRMQGILGPGSESAQ